MVAIERKDKTTSESLGTGRRKTAVARVRLKEGSGKIVINDRPLEEYFLNEQDRNAVISPLEKAGKRANVDIRIKVHGGGPAGQAGACLLGISRALCSLDASLYETLRDGPYLTRDSRMKERKKYGLRGARRGVQFSKR